MLCLGAGAHIFFDKPAYASGGGGSSSSSEAEDGSSHGNVFVEMDPLMLPIIDGNGVSQIVNMVVALEVSSERNANKVRDMEPRIVDAYIQNMYGILSQQMAVKNGMLQVSVIKRRLKEITIDIVGDDIVKDVLLQILEQRRL